MAVVLESVPHDAVQVTVVLAVSITVAVNVWVPPKSTLAIVGDTEIPTGGPPTAIEAIADLVLSATLVTVMTALHAPEEGAV